MPESKLFQLLYYIVTSYFWLRERIWDGEVSRAEKCLSIVTEKKEQGTGKRKEEVTSDWHTQRYYIYIYEKTITL